MRLENSARVFGWLPLTVPLDRDLGPLLLVRPRLAERLPESFTMSRNVIQGNSAPSPGFGLSRRRFPTWRLSVVGLANLHTAAHRQNDVLKVVALGEATVWMLEEAVV